MIGRMLIEGALGAVGLAAGAARHFAWYLSYQVDGTVRPHAPHGRSTRPPQS